MPPSEAPAGAASARALQEALRAALGVAEREPMAPPPLALVQAVGVTESTSNVYDVGFVPVFFGHVNRPCCSLNSLRKNF